MKSRRGPSFVSMTLLVLTVGLAAGGCATGVSETRHGLGVGYWQMRMPTTASPIHELAYGRDGSSRPALEGLDTATPDAVLQPQPVLQPLAAPIAKAKPAATQRRAPALALAKAVEEQPAEQPALATLANEVTTAPAATQSTQLAVNDAGSRYAQRESQASEQQKFRGGDAIVISAGAIVIVLLIVVLILLLR